MGEVFLATQVSVDRLVAVKVLPPGFAADQTAVKRFLQEGKLAARLDHANIATVHEAGEDGGHYYLAMAYVEGESLDRRLKQQGTLPETEALGIARSVADALAYSWETFQLLHRDIKPANIMVDHRQRVFLMDLGLAKSLADGSGVTLSGTVLGTPLYMSPEQAEGQADLGVASDVYSLGATLYHLVTGAPPFSGKSTLQILHQHLHGPLPPPRERNPALSAGCTRLLETMLAKRPEERYDGWGAVLASIDRVLDGGVPQTGWTAGKKDLRDKASVARQAQEALARQHQPPDMRKPTCAATGGGLRRRTVALLSGAALVAALFATIAVVLIRRGDRASGIVAPTEGKSGEAALAGGDHDQGTAASVPAEHKALDPQPPQVSLPVGATATAAVAEPCATSTPTRPTDRVALAAQERFALPRTGDWCLGFDGRTSYVVMPTLRYDGIPPITVEAVVRPMGTGAEPLQGLVGNIEGGGVWLVRNGSAWQFRLNASFSSCSVAQSPMTDGRSVHLAGVWDGTRQRLFVNGVLVADEAWSMRVGTDAPFMVGANPGPAGEFCGRSFIGDIECVRITRAARYTRGFALEDVLPFTPDQETLCLLDFEEGQGKVAKDSSGNKHDGEIHGAIWRQTWPCPVPEDQLRQAEQALRQANPDVPSLSLAVTGRPGGIGVTISDQKGLRNIDALRGLPVVDLYLDNTDVSDLSPLRGPRLRQVRISHSPVRDLSPLAGSSLVALSIKDTQVSDLSPLRGLPLRFLHLFQAPVSDLSPLEGMPLAHLAIVHTQVVDISVVAGMPLRSIALSDGVTDTSPLKSCPLLELVSARRDDQLAGLEDAMPNTTFLARDSPDPEHQDPGDAKWMATVYGQILPDVQNEIWQNATASSKEADIGRLLAPLAGPILTGRSAEALAAWHRDSQRLVKTLTDEQRQTVAAQIRAVATMDAQILSTFRADINKAVTVELTNQKVLCLVRGVRDDGIQVMQTIHDGRTTGKVGRVLRPLDLSIAEKLRRLGTEETPERNLQRGMLALQANRMDVARRFFAKAGQPLGPALTQGIDQRQARETERAACRALDELLRQVGSPSRRGTKDTRMAEIHAQCTGNARRTERALRLVGEFEKQWGKDGVIGEWASAVRESVLAAWPAEGWTVPELGMELMWVAPGRFRMGSEQHEQREKPVHEVQISRGFWMGKFEVLQAEYRAIMADTPSRSADPRSPVDTVAWNSAVTFCRKLTERERAAGRLRSGYEYRLPTEAEWEYAARGGQLSKGYVYAGAASVDEAGWHRGNSGIVRHPVGQKRANELGLYDMCGNLWEWCLDAYDESYYRRSPATDPVNLSPAPNRVRRGGGWNDAAKNVRSTSRDGYSAEVARDFIGFRICLAPQLDGQ